MAKGAGAVYSNSWSADQMTDLLMNADWLLTDWMNELLIKLLI